MLSIALTGGIGSGKSLAAECFAGLGAIVIDSDQLAREVIERGQPGFDEVVAQFGDSILTDGAIDRIKLSQLVFTDSAARAKLESIIHPKVRSAAAQIAAGAGEGAIVITQIPLLFETNGAQRFDLVITIAANLETRKERLLKRGLKSYEIEQRLAAQATDEQRASISDFVIQNDGDIEDLERFCIALWNEELAPRVRK